MRDQSATTRIWENMLRTLLMFCQVDSAQRQRLPFIDFA
jgi:hypothetical protein